MIMKKNVFYKVMMMAMIAVVSMIFTACGGDSDDDGTPQVPTGPTGSTEYVDPCLDFGSSVAHVKEWMSGSNWELSEHSNEGVLLYTNIQTMTVLNYIFIESKLHMVTVAYTGSGESKVLAFKAEIEKRYGISMTKETDPSDASQYSYYGTATIGGKKVVIMLNHYKTGISIVYGLPD